MSDQNNCRCGGARSFDAEAAYQRLARQHARLVDVVSTYMGEAGLDRETRVRHAGALASRLERIVGGVTTVAYPECCIIGQRGPGGERWFCTGVLVHPRVVLTAAHCHTPPSLSANIVALGASNVNALSGAEHIRARRTVANPKYPSTGRHDISVLILAHEAQTAPVPIAKTAELGAAQCTTLVGFGNSNVESTHGFGVKRKVTVDLVSVRRSDEDDLDGDETRYGFESDLEFVAGGDGYDSCNGDSGGPAYIEVGRDRRVAGLTSRGFNWADNPCGDGGIYTRVDAQRDFISQVMEANGLDPAEL